MAHKVLIPLYGDDVGPRFDMSTEVLVAVLDDNGNLLEEKMVVLPEASGEKLCHMILLEGVKVVICGGIEEELYQYLRWKRVKVLDSVIGPYREALRRYSEGRLQSGDILFSRNSGTSA